MARERFILTVKIVWHNGWAPFTLRKMYKIHFLGAQLDRHKNNTLARLTDLLDSFWTNSHMLYIAPGRCRDEDLTGRTYQTSFNTSPPMVFVKTSLVFMKATYNSLIKQVRNFNYTVLTTYFEWGF